MGSWMDATGTGGLYRKYGVTKAVPNTAGEYKTFGDRRYIEVKIALTSLTTSDVIQSDQVFFPINARIEAVTITTLAAATTSTSALLNVGLYQTDRTTAIDADGILAVATTANMTLGNEVRQVKGGATAGALVGSGAAATTVPAYITAATSTGTFSAGSIIVRIEYMVP